MLKKIFLLSILIALNAGAETIRTQGLSFHADHYTRDSENETEELEGHVQVIYQNQHLKCDRAIIHARAKTVDAIGDVLITTPRANIGGDRVVLNLDDGTGVIYNGYVQSGTVLFQGAMIFRTSEIDYVANDAEYTTCTTCPEAWNFSGSTIRAQLGGYAYIRNSTLRLAGMPVFWFPYMVVPLKSQRQTGFLTPGFADDSTGGFTFLQPFFWAISPSQDATFTFENYQNRGQKGLLEYNYVLSPTSNGTLKAAIIDDHAFAKDPNYLTFHPHPQSAVGRWDINYSHYYDLPDNFINRVQLNNASDIHYLNDFSSETHPSYDPALEDRISFSKVDGKNLYLLDSSYYTNLLQSDPLANNDNAVQRLPEVNWSTMVSPTGFDHVLWSMNADFTNFTRTGFGYDHLNQGYIPSTVTNTQPDPQGRYIANNCPQNNSYPLETNNPYYTDNTGCRATPGGAYNANTDLIRTGQRFDFQPTLYRPFRIGYLDFLPTASYRETDYDFGVGSDPTLSRKYLQAGISARTLFSRVYGDLDHVEGERIKHEIQPEISYTKIPWFQQRNHPFFGYVQNSFVPNTNQANVTNSDLNSPFALQFDYDDRVGDRDLIQIGVTNFLTKKTFANGAANYLQFFSWKLTQGYDFLEASSANLRKQPFTDLGSDLRFTLPYFQAVQQFNYYPYQQVSNSDTTIKFTDTQQDALNLRYSSRYTVTPDLPVDKSTRIDQYSAIARKYGKIMDLVGTVAYGNPGVSTASQFTLWAYGVEFKIPGDCSSVRIFHTSYPQPETVVNFGFVWDGQANSTFIKNLSSQAPFGI